MNVERRRSIKLRLQPDDRLKLQLDAFLEHARVEGNAPGISAAVSVEGNRVHSFVGVCSCGDNKRVGKASQFHLGCMMKLLVAVVVLELVSAKELELMLPIEEYLSELRDSKYGRSVSLAHLLSHTSGFRGTDMHDRKVSTMSWDKLVDYLRSAPPDFAPGTVFNYEHSGAVIAAEIVSRVTGKSIFGQISELVFEGLDLAVGVIGSEGQRELDAGMHRPDASTGELEAISFSDLAARTRHISSMWKSTFSPYALSVEALLRIAEYFMGQANVPDFPRRSP